MSGVDDYGSQEIRNSMQKELEAQRAEQDAMLARYQAEDSSGFRAQQGGGVNSAAQGGINPGMGMQIGSQFMGGGSGAVGGGGAEYTWANTYGAGGTAAGSGGGAAATSGVSGAGATGGASAGSGAGSAMSGLMSNPYAWIAAAIIANETWQTKTGNRRNGLDGWKDRVSGAVLRQDSDRYAKHLFKDDMSGDKTGIGGDMNLGADFGSPMTLKKIPKDLKNSSIGKIFKKIF